VFVAVSVVVTVVLGVVVSSTLMMVKVLTVVEAGVGRNVDVASSVVVSVTVLVCARAVIVVVVFAVLTEVLAGAYVVTCTLHSTFFGHWAEALRPVPGFAPALRSFARATRPPLFG